MNRASETKKRWVRLDHSEREAGVVVSPENEDRFALTMELAIRGCKLGSQMDKLNGQMAQLFEKLHGWVQSHDRDIGQAYVVVRDTGLLFMIVQRDRKFNHALEDELTNLDMEIAQDADYDLIVFGVRSLPQSDEETITAYLTQDSAFSYQNAGRIDTSCNSKS